MRQRRVKQLGQLTGKLTVLVRTRLWAQIIAGMTLGIGVGIILSPSGAGVVPERLASLISAWLALPGHVFLALIQMVVLPLVVSSIVLGIVAGGDPARLRHIGVRIAPYFVGTTVVAVIIGTSLSVLIRPGDFIGGDMVQVTRSETKPTTTPEAAVLAESTPLPDRITDLIPSNLTAAALERSMLQIVVFAIIIGIALVSVSRERAKPLVDIAGAVQEVSMTVVGWAMLLAPLAVFGLLAQVMTQIGLDALVGISVYVGTVLLGLLLLLLFYLAIVWVVARRSPLQFLVGIRDVQLLAFSTSSSAAVMPLSITAAEERLGVTPSIVHLVVPLGATVNMDGTALYQVVAAVFLTQVFGVELSFPALALLAATTVGASIGSPSTPGVGIVILATILTGIGVPATGIAMIIGVDRILDMCRTAVNVTGDLTACTVMERWAGDAVSPDAPSA